jgi:hypothetical protein
MIRRPTVLVLGAGVSTPFGFPSGYGLLQQVLDPFFRDKLTAHVHDEPLVDAFLEALRFSGMLSVDAFLERRTEFLEVGKTAIALTLMPLERPEVLRDRPQSPRWLDLLWAKLVAKPEDFPKNQLTIITFNYDRLVEFYLLTALRHTYGISEDQAATLLETISILHVHGQLGALASPHGRSFDSDPSPHNVKVAVSGIRVVHELAMDDVGFVTARRALVAAERVYFLGFGYLSENLRRLEIASLVEKRELHGSAMGIEKGEMVSIQAHFGGKLQVEYTDAANFLRNVPQLDD